MFWKRKQDEPAQQRAANTQPQRSGAPTGVGKFTTIIVPRSALLRAADPDKAYDLVQAVINFVNTMMGEGIYSRDEIPAKAMQAYHADYYLGQVNNGGHSQFIRSMLASASPARTQVRRSSSWRFAVDGQWRSKGVTRRSGSLSPTQVSQDIAL